MMGEENITLFGKYVSSNSFMDTDAEDIYFFKESRSILCQGMDGFKQVVSGDNFSVYHIGDCSVKIFQQHTALCSDKTALVIYNKDGNKRTNAVSELEASL